MSGFTFKDEDGREVQDIRRCTNCGFVQLRKHFGDDGKCPACLEYPELEELK